MRLEILQVCAQVMTVIIRGRVGHVKGGSSRGRLLHDAEEEEEEEEEGGEAKEEQEQEEEKKEDRGSRETA